MELCKVQIQVQFDVTVRDSAFIVVSNAFDAAAFSEI